jgi:signal transduction histidine kinase
LYRAADLVAAELRGRLAETEEALTQLAATSPTDVPSDAARFASDLSHDAVLVVLGEDQVHAFPAGRLFYYPVLPTPAEVPARVFAEGEALEFRARDYAGAAQAYRRLARAHDSSRRAGALLRLARVERKAGQRDRALASYAALAQLGSTALGGVPSELVARHARLSLLEELNRSDDLRREADSLFLDLQSCRWRLMSGSYRFYTDRAAQWSSPSVRDSAPHQYEAALAVAEAVEWLWETRQSRSAAGREIRSISDPAVLVVWRGGPDREVALVGGPGNLETDWLGPLATVLARENVDLEMTDAVGNRLVSSAARTDRVQIIRSVAETRLPWTLRLWSADPSADTAELGERRRLMLFGAVALALLLSLGLYAVIRGVSRELEVARLQSDFVAAVSHEFRTPLTSLRQLAELLSSGRVVSDERRAKYYEIMERESGRLHRLVEGLLDFGRMEAGALEFSWERVTPSVLVRRIVKDFEAELGESGYHVEVTTDATASTVRADSEALGRAVWNLLDNAVKYSPDRKAVWVNVSQVQERVAIAVRDEGVGIPPAERDAIFAKFVRGTCSGGRGTKGTGIGLAMVKHIVEAHGGDIRVESEVGQGSRFTILLPVEE